MNGFFQLLRNLGPARLLMIALMTAGTIAFFYYLANKVNAPEMGLLFSDLDLKDSAAVVHQLETQNVPYQLQADGSQVLVPVDQVMKLRMALAEQGLPQGGSVGYEIFDKTDQFGPSQFVENINQLRALEGELERTIASLSLVQSARVHLVLPQRELFSREAQQASASIVLKLRGANKLTNGQVAAIQHLVAAAVPSLSPSKVSIVDDEGNLLARGDGDASDALTSSNAEEMRVNYENRMARNVEQLIERSVGVGKARVDVHAEMNFDRVTTNSETYDPDGQVVRSTQTDNQSDQSGANTAAAAVSVSTNLPGGQTAPSSSDNKQTKSTHTQETTNYEISKTVKNQISDQGTVKRLSVAVLVDGTTTVGADGKKTYQPRSADELKQLTALVRTAVGYDEQRGDSVEVVNLPFAGADELPPPPAAWNLMGLEKGDLIYLGETGGVALIGLLILMLVIKPMIGRFLDTAKAMGSGAMPAAALGGPAGTAALPAPNGGGTAVARAAPQGETIDIGQVEGRVAASSMKKIGEIVEKHPDEAVSIVRSWMYQDN